MQQIQGVDIIAGSPAKLGMAPPLTPFRERAPWLGGDLQTLRNRFFPPPAPPTETERLVLPLANGAGALSAALNRPVPTSGQAPAVLLVHGLGGCEDSAYMLIAAHSLLARGYPVIRLNLRGAGPSARFSKAPYHAGLTDDLRDALAGIARSLPGRPIIAVGFSLGGHMLLRLAGEDGRDAPLDGLMTVSAPLDLAAAQCAIAQARNRVYERYIVAMMARDLGAPTAFPRRLRAVDDTIVAPAHGFAGADDYYRRASAFPLVAGVRIPAAILHADNDPWIPADAYRQATWPSGSAVTVAITRGGGHVGFHGRRLREPWYVTTLLHFLTSCIGHQAFGK